MSDNKEKLQDALGLLDDDLLLEGLQILKKSLAEIL